MSLPFLLSQFTAVAAKQNANLETPSIKLPARELKNTQDSRFEHEFESK